MYEGEPNEDLVRRAQAGSQDAWDALVRRFANRVYSTARSYGMNHADADEVFQITWERLLHHLDGIREPDKLGAWLATTAKRECLRILKQRRRVELTEDSELDLPDLAAAPVDAGLLRDEKRHDVWDAVRGLPAHCQRLLRYLMADPLPTYEEITAALDMPQGSIGPTRRRCLDHLRKRLGKDPG